LPRAPGVRPGALTRDKRAYPRSARKRELSYGSIASTVTRAGAGLVGAVDRLELLQAPPRADGHAGERALGQVDGHLGLVAEALVEAGQRGAAAREADTAVHDVGGTLRG